MDCLVVLSDFVQEERLDVYGPAAIVYRVLKKITTSKVFFLDKNSNFPQNFIY